MEKCNILQQTYWKKVYLQMKISRFRKSAALERIRRRRVYFPTAKASPWFKNLGAVFVYYVEYWQKTAKRVEFARSLC